MGQHLHGQLPVKGSQVQLTKRILQRQARDPEHSVRRCSAAGGQQLLGMMWFHEGVIEHSEGKGSAQRTALLPFTHRAVQVTLQH